MIGIESRLAAIHRRFARHPLTSGVSIHVVNEARGIDLAISSEDTPRRHFIASATKPMLAVAVVRALDAQGVSVDTRVADILPKEMVGVPFGNDITVRQLLSHTSGMFDYWAIHGLRAHRGPGSLLDWAEHHPGWTVDEVLELVRKNPPAAPPGQRFAYCGTNYQLATRVLEELSGSSAEDAFRDLVFEPAGMVESALFVRDSISTIDSIAPVKYGAGTYRGARRMASLAGEGAVVSTTADTNRFLEWVSGETGLSRGVESLLDETQAFSPGIDYGLGTMAVRLPAPLTNRIPHSPLSAITG